MLKSQLISMLEEPVESQMVLDFLKLFPKQKNPSAMRHYAKIVSILTDRKSSLYKEVLSRAKLDPLIETLFTWLIDEQVLVATKVHCMQALANLVSERAWIKNELLDTIDHLVGVESIAFFARAKMVKKTLKKHNDDL